MLEHMSDSEEYEGWFAVDIHPWVFFSSALIIIGSVAAAVVFQAQLGDVFASIQSAIATNVGWFFVMTMNIILVFVLVLMVSPPRGHTVGWVRRQAGVFAGRVVRHALQRRYGYRPPVLQRRGTDVPLRLVPFGGAGNLRGGAARHGCDVFALGPASVGDIRHGGTGTRVLCLQQRVAALHSIGVLPRVG